MDKINKEIWKDCEDNTDYQVSNLGRIKSKHRMVNSKNGKKTVRERILKQSSCNGYKYVFLGSIGCFRVHRLVAKAFILNPLNKREVNHIDCNRGNNIVTNLEWVTSSENHKHAYKHGKVVSKTQLGKKSIQSSSAKPVIVTDKNGKIVNVFPCGYVCANRLNLKSYFVYYYCRKNYPTKKGITFNYISKKEYYKLSGKGRQTL